MHNSIQYPRDRHELHNFLGPTLGWAPSPRPRLQASDGPRMLPTSSDPGLLPEMEVLHRRPQHVPCVGTWRLGGLLRGWLACRLAGQFACWLACGPVGSLASTVALDMHMSLLPHCSWQASETPRQPSTFRCTVPPQFLTRAGCVPDWASPVPDWAGACS